MRNTESELEHPMMGDVPNLRQTQWCVLLRHFEDPEGQRIYRESTAVCNKLVAAGWLDDADGIGYLMNERGRKVTSLALEELRSGVRSYKPFRLAVAEAQPFLVLLSDPDEQVRELSTSQLVRDQPLSYEVVKQLAESEFPCQRLYAAGRKDIRLSWFEHERHPQVVRRLTEKHPEWLDDGRIKRLIQADDPDLLSTLLDLRSKDRHVVRSLVETHRIDDRIAAKAFGRMTLRLTDDELESILWYGNPKAVEYYLECFDDRWETSEELVDHWIDLGDERLLRTIVTGNHSILMNSRQLDRVIGMGMLDAGKLMGHQFESLTTTQFERLFEIGGPEVARGYEQVARAHGSIFRHEPSARMLEMIEAAKRR